MPTKTNRTYGKKKVNILASDTIFSTSSQDFTMPQCLSQRGQTIGEKTTEYTNEQYDELSERPVDQTDELVDAVAALELEPQAPKSPRMNKSFLPSKRRESPPTTPILEHSYLDSLLELAENDDLPISLESWTSILPPDSKLTKIAEASFAEVYRITASSTTSIVKIMPLKSPDDPASLDRSCASSITDVIPELRIMNTLTEIPGFVTFKGARIVTGNQSPEFVKAWELWGKRNDYQPEEDWPWNSEFDHPSDYADDALFLAIELGDAGEVLEDVAIDTIDKAWDVWLGAVIALARAEVLHEFEHRDLHENNICIFAHPRHRSLDTARDLLYRRSGLEVTLLDYGLSRARLHDGTVTFRDLETDLEIFRGKRWHRQFETYRQMRSHLFNSSLEQQPLAWHKSDRSRESMSEAGRSWEEHTPQSNVLWLSYLLDYLILQYTTNGPAKKKSTNREEIEETFVEMQDLLNFNPKSRIEGERFSSAADCLSFCIEMEWVDEDQLNEDLDVSVLISEGSFLRDKKPSEGIMTPQCAGRRVKPQHTFISPTPQKMVLRSRTPSPAKSQVVIDGQSTHSKNQSSNTSSETVVEQQNLTDGKLSEAGAVVDTVPEVNRALRSKKKRN